jgi:D-alanine-D-alanine ligase
MAKHTFNDCVILFGGNSDERLVSVASAQNLAANVPEAKLWFLAQDGSVFEVSHQQLGSHQNAFTEQFRPVISPRHPSLEAALSELKNKVVILALHGTEGEDGSIQKLFEDAGVSYTGTKSNASAKAFDKVVTKEIANANGLPLAAELRVERYNDTELESLNAFFKEHKKIVLKPSSSGSSVGLYIVDTQAALDDSIEKMKKNKIPYLAEEFITGREITVGVRQRADGSVSALPCSEVRVIQGRQFDYQGKYLGQGVEELTPAPLEASDTKKCQELAIKVHTLMGCRGYTRTDMILTDRGPVLLEINTLPGLSKASFIPQQLAANGEKLRDFFLEQINL